MNSTIESSLRGRQLLDDPSLNKSTAFDDDERTSLGLVGLLPDAVEELSDQLIRTKSEFDKLHDDLERHIFCLLYTSPSPRDRQKSRMPSSA